MQEVFEKTENTNNKIDNNEEYFSTLGTPAILADGKVPLSHKRAADDFIIIKRFYKSQTVRTCIMSSEKELLAKYGLYPLSQLSIKDVNNEIRKLQVCSFSDNADLKHDADLIIQIRAKELKYILSSKYVLNSSEINNGFKALERYFEQITKYYNLPH